MQVKELLLEALSGACQSIAEASAYIPINLMSEAVFRNMFALRLAQLTPTSKVLIECDKIDLVAHISNQVAYLEFKYYVHSRVFDPYTLKARGWKSHPSPANFRQFQKSIDQLRERTPALDISRAIVLLYADPPPPIRRSKYSDYYQDSTRLAPLRIVEMGSPIDFICRASGHNCHASMFQVDA
jgi:hypothetical protein